MKNLKKISAFLFLLALLLVLSLGSCAKTELEGLQSIGEVDQNKSLSSKEDLVFDNRSDEHDDDFVTDDEDDDEEEEDDKK